MRLAWARFAVSVVGASITFGALGCHSHGPSERTEWRACLIEAGKMKVTNEDEIQIGLGEEPVLLMRAQWDRTPWLALFSDYVQGELGATLAGGVSEGATTTLSKESVAYYREATDVLLYGSRNLAGTIVIVHSGKDQVDLAIDLRAEDPRVDLERRGVTTIKGTRTAKRVTRAADCL